MSVHSFKEHLRTTLRIFLMFAGDVYSSYSGVWPYWWRQAVVAWQPWATIAPKLQLYTFSEMIKIYWTSLDMAPVLNLQFTWRSTSELTGMLLLIWFCSFGRIGRLVFRASLNNPDCVVTAINDPFLDVDYMVLHILKKLSRSTWSNMTQPMGDFMVL